VDPERTEEQAEALLATRHILARLKPGEAEAWGGPRGRAHRREDWQMLAHDIQWRVEGALRVFAEWHALGTDPEAALWEMRERLRGAS
jgi:hypothetical protein